MPICFGRKKSTVELLSHGTKIKDFDSPKKKKGIIIVSSGGWFENK